MLTVAQTMQNNYLTSYGRKVESTGNSNFGNYPGDNRL